MVRFTSPVLDPYAREKTSMEAPPPEGGGGGGYKHRKDLPYSWGCDKNADGLGIGDCPLLAGAGSE